MSEPLSSPAGLAIHSHLNLQQAVIQKFSATRTACKTLAVVLVVVFFVMTRTGPTPSFWLLAPLGMLVLLDACSLAGERLERRAREIFLNQLKDTVPDRLKTLDLPPSTSKTIVTASNLEAFLWALLSPTIWLYYGMLAAITAFIPVNATAGSHPAMLMPPYSNTASPVPGQMPGSRPLNSSLPPSSQGPKPRTFNSNSPTPVRPVAPVPQPGNGSPPQLPPSLKPPAPASSNTPLPQPQPIQPPPSQPAPAAKP